MARKGAESSSLLESEAWRDLRGKRGGDVSKVQKERPTWQGGTKCGGDETGTERLDCWLAGLGSCKQRRANKRDGDEEK